MTIVLLTSEPLNGISPNHADFDHVWSAAKVLVSEPA